MIEIKGQFTNAKVMLPEDSPLDQTTLSQIYSFINLEIFRDTNIVIQPDTHAGAGSVIGFTMPVTDFIVPNIVGVDIGCGVCAFKLGKIPKGDIDLKKLDKFIRENIPFGFDVHKRTEQILSSETLKLVNRIGIDKDRVELSIGTLGGGNHFIELGIDEKKQMWLTIHSGSRNFGLQVAQFYQKIAIKKMSGGVPKSLAYLKGADMEEYLDAMRIAQRYALLNRQVMGSILIEKFFKLKMRKVEQVESIHNFIDFEDNIIRKGAIRSYNDEFMVIPFNMLDGLIIAKGKSNPDWNYSAPHGAGRVLSRTQAKSRLDLNQAKQDMKKAGIFTTSLTASSIDEWKDAYKDKELIMRAIDPTAEVLHFVKPIYNFKAG